MAIKMFKKQKQLMAIYANKYEVVYTHANPEMVSRFAKENRSRLKKAGALKVITNIGYY
jgi:hypothetical protein